MAYSDPLPPLLLHHQGGGPQVHEGQGALQHTEAGGGVQPVPGTGPSPAVSNIDPALLLSDLPERLDIPEDLQVLVDRKI